MKLKKTRI